MDAIVTGSLQQSQPECLEYKRHAEAFTEFLSQYNIQLWCEPTQHDPPDYHLFIHTDVQAERQKLQADVTHQMWLSLR